jgi:hypothetical protein
LPAFVLILHGKLRTGQGINKRKEVGSRAVGRAVIVAGQRSKQQKLGEQVSVRFDSSCFCNGKLRRGPADQLQH